MAPATYPQGCWRQLQCCWWKVPDTRRQNGDPCNIFYCRKALTLFHIFHWWKSCHPGPFWGSPRIGSGATPIYIDQVTTVSLSQNSKLKLFADDVLLYKTIYYQTGRLHCNSTPLQTGQMLTTLCWILQSASLCMVISWGKKLSCATPQLLLNSHLLDQVITFKYLGVLVSSDMSLGTSYCIDMR